MRRFTVWVLMICLTVGTSLPARAQETEDTPSKPFYKRSTFWRNAGIVGGAATVTSALLFYPFARNLWSFGLSAVGIPLAVGLASVHAVSGGPGWWKKAVSDSAAVMTTGTLLGAPVVILTGEMLEIFLGTTPGWVGLPLVFGAAWAASLASGSALGKSLRRAIPHLADAESIPSQQGVTQQIDAIGGE
ncbi:MAG: hypothetical protein HYY16_17235 [Planctomycetes bacterium]|nr:hypothetical protein [Planctomycetota bacterium]